MPMMKSLSAALMATVLVAAPVLAQDKPADNMQVLLEKVKADKKYLVANNMNLTEEEAKGFWPIYDAYQKDLQDINSRMQKTIKAYADAYNAGPVPDATAQKLMDEMLAIEDSEVKLKRNYVPKLEKVLSASKTARYLQLESKIRAAIKYDMAKSIPLVQ
jgi:Spy/CpxP family protein refolding chaperone